MGTGDDWGRADVKPAPFDYHDPETLEEALALLADLGDEASILAGGQSLIPLLNLRLAQPSAIVDIRRVPRLDDLEISSTELRVGATSRAATLESSREVAQAIPCIVEALRDVGHPQIRNRTTIGGNIAHADPSSELPAVLLALEGTVTLQSRERGRRVVSADDFFYSVFWTTRQSDELLTEVTFPIFPGRSVFLEVARRRGDFALVGACVATAVSDGTVRDARIALCGVGDRPVRAVEAEQSLIGGQATSDIAGEIAALAIRDLSPPSDLHGSGEYRSALAGVLVERALDALLKEE